MDKSIFTTKYTWLTTNTIKQKKVKNEVIGDASKMNCYYNL